MDRGIITVQELDSFFRHNYVLRLFDVMRWPDDSEWGLDAFALHFQLLANVSSLQK